MYIFIWIIHSGINKKDIVIQSDSLIGTRHGTSKIHVMQAARSGPLPTPLESQGFLWKDWAWVDSSQLLAFAESRLFSSHLLLDFLFCGLISTCQILGLLCVYIYVLFCLLQKMKLDLNLLSVLYPGTGEVASSWKGPFGMWEQKETGLSETQHLQAGFVIRTSH